MRKLEPEKMKEKINKGYYITYYSDTEQYELSHDNSKGYAGGVIITKERAQEWINLGAELLEM
jgi:hypothetical protein